MITTADPSSKEVMCIHQVSGLNMSWRVTVQWQHYDMEREADHGVPSALCGSGSLGNLRNVCLVCLGGLL